jgi:putative membrane protein
MPPPARLVGIGLAAAVAISAMVLPGISGSFVLLMLGVYFDLLAAIDRRQIVVLAVFALGCGGGLLVFVRIMNVLLNRFYSVTMAFMIGLMAGSLYVLWPFKRTVTVGAETLYLGNVLRGASGGEEATALCAFLAGALLIIAFDFLTGCGKKGAA